MVDELNSSQSPAETQALESVERHLDRIDKRLVRLERKQGLPVPGEEEGKETSRLIIAGGLALVGAKLLGAVGAKIGGARGLAALKKAEGALPQNLAHALSDKRVLKPMLMDGIAGSALGAALGGLVGWKRGDRIENAHELLTSPIQSIKKLAQSESSYQEQKAKERLLLDELSGDVKQVRNEELPAIQKESVGKFSKKVLADQEAASHHSI